MPKIPKPPKGWYSNDVYWYMRPKRKRPVAYSTVACEHYIIELAKEGGTIKEMRDMIYYDEEAKMVLDAYIKYGWGDKIGKEIFRL